MVVHLPYITVIFKRAISLPTHLIFDTVKDRGNIFQRTKKRVLRFLGFSKLFQDYIYFLIILGILDRMCLDIAYMLNNI